MPHLPICVPGCHIDHRKRVHVWTSPTGRRYNIDGIPYRSDGQQKRANLDDLLASSDTTSFLMIKDDDQDSAVSRQVIVVLGWAEELSRLSKA